MSSNTQTPARVTIRAGDGVGEGWREYVINLATLTRPTDGNVLIADYDRSIKTPTYGFDDIRYGHADEVLSEKEGYGLVVTVINSGMVSGISLGPGLMGWDQSTWLQLHVLDGVDVKELDKLVMEALGNPKVVFSQDDVFKGMNPTQDAEGRPAAFPVLTGTFGEEEIGHHDDGAPWEQPGHPLADHQWWVAAPNEDE